MMRKGIKQRKVAQEAQYIIAKLLQRPYIKNNVDDIFNMVDIMNVELKRVLKSYDKFVYKRSKYE